MVLIAPIGSFVLHVFILWSFYVLIELAAWVKLRRKDPLWIVLLFPIYAKFTAGARFIAHFYWLKKKYVYSFKNRFHRMIDERHLLMEYGFLLVLLSGLWFVALFKLSRLLTTPAAAAKLQLSFPRGDYLAWGSNVRLWLIVAVLIGIYATVKIYRGIKQWIEHKPIVLTDESAGWVARSVLVEKD